MIIGSWTGALVRWGSFEDNLSQTKHDVFELHCVHTIFIYFYFEIDVVILKDDVMLAEIVIF